MLAKKMKGSTTWALISVVKIMVTKHPTHVKITTDNRGHTSFPLTAGGSYSPVHFSKYCSIQAFKRLRDISFD